MLVYHRVSIRLARATFGSVVAYDTWGAQPRAKLTGMRCGKLSVFLSKFWRVRTPNKLTDCIQVRSITCPHCISYLRLCFILLLCVAKKQPSSNFQ